MTKYDVDLTNLLKLEVAKKGQPATFAFLGFALFSLYYGYGCVEYLPHIRAISMTLLLITLIRYFLYKKIINQNFISEKDWIQTVILIFLNGIGYALILWLASFELKLSGLHFVIVTTLIAGLVGSSIVTLAYFPFLFVPYQAFLLLPQVGNILYFYFAENLNYLPLIFLYVIYFFYQIKQSHAFRIDLAQTFIYQLELEKMNKELNESKNVIIEQTAKLVHASRLAVMGEMSAGVAHEINNPLTIIASCVQMINRNCKAEKIDPTNMVKYSEKIHKSVERIASIVKGLKYFANQNDKMPKKSYGIHEIMKETTPFCMEHLNSLEISLKMDEIPNVEIYCHPVQISQVLINLLKNAADAIPEKFEALDRWVQVNFKVDQEYFYFVVSNGGVKIEESVADKIFNPFFTTKDNGTGLGLSISQTIIKDHGGELYLDLTSTQTTFIIKHPLNINQCSNLS